MCCSSNSTLKSNEKDNEIINLKLSNDFGYLNKSEGIDILDKIKMSSKADKGWEIIKQNDTVGKYFKSKETGNYILCIIDVQNKLEFETHILIELKKRGKTSFMVVAKERYLHGNYPCLTRTKEPLAVTAPCRILRGHCVNEVSAFYYLCCGLTVLCF